MGLNRALIGREYPVSAAYEVGIEKIREFARAIGEDDPLFHDREAARAVGYPDLLAPPTFPFTITREALSHAMFDPELGLDYGRVVHGEQSFHFERPIHAGDVLHTHARIADIGVRGANEFLVNEAELRTPEGELVVTTRAVIISRGTAE